MESVAGGATLASTSIGIATRLMQQERILNTPVGSLITAAAMLDDVFSLILLSIITQLASENGEDHDDTDASPSHYAWLVLHPLVASFGAAVVGCLATWLLPKILTKVENRMGIATLALSPTSFCDTHHEEHAVEAVVVEHNDKDTVRAPEQQTEEVNSNSNSTSNNGDSIVELEDFNDNDNNEDNATSQRRARKGKQELLHEAQHQQDKIQKKVLWYEGLQVLFMMLYGLLFSVVAGIAGSTYLLGAFLAGFSFSKVPNTERLWQQHVAPFATWLTRIFFASIGFVIPLKQMFQSWTVLYGLLNTAPAIVAKLATGVFVKPVMTDGLVVGFAMVGRGELGFVMATQALHDKVITADCFTVTVWALLLSTLLAPFLFTWALRRKHNKQAKKAQLEGDTVTTSSSQATPVEQTSTDDAHTE